MLSATFIADNSNLQIVKNKKIRGVMINAEEYTNGQTLLKEVLIKDKSETNFNELHYKVLKRNGMMVPFCKTRILKAIESAFRDVRKISVDQTLSYVLKEAVIDTTNTVIEEVVRNISLGKVLSVESIQDIIEAVLMATGFHDVARGYILYRDHHAAKREASSQVLKVLRRDGSAVKFNPIKISYALHKAFQATYNVGSQGSEGLVECVNGITNKIVAYIFNNQEAKVLDIEQVQDAVERHLMVDGYYEVAKNYILYRSARAHERELVELKKKVPFSEMQEQVIKNEVAIPSNVVRYNVIRSDNTSYFIDQQTVALKMQSLCARFDSKIISANELSALSFSNFYNDMKEEEVDLANIMAARAKIEKEPEYAFVAADLLVDVLFREVIGVSITDVNLNVAHKKYFYSYLDFGISIGRLDPRLKDYDIEMLSNALVLERDRKFAYLGIQTLYDRYFLQHEGRRIETPQIFWMRVAMGVALNEGEQKTAKAIEFYNLLSTFLFTSATPTLFNAGTIHPQLSSCYLSIVMDDLQHIFKFIADDALLSKWAGGIGNDWTNIRATGSLIKGTNGVSQGVIPFMKVAGDTAIAVNQGGKRKGAMCAYLELWHLDIEDFLELRKNTGDERRRTHDMNTANWVPDLFFKRLLKNEVWTLFSPSDVPDLHHIYGKEFEKAYEQYEKKILAGEIKLFKKIDCNVLWRKMLGMVYETGHPWITFKDPSNIRSTQDHVGVIHSSNLCTEILLNTSEEETAVCNLGSINLPAHIKDFKIDEELLTATIKTAVRMLDNVIDINFYPTKEAKTANMRHRPIGLGLMGFQDMLYQLNISYASDEAVTLSDRTMELISYYAIIASTELAQERGVYSSYKGSKWDRGLLPIDTLDLLEQERGHEYVELNKDIVLDWQPVRDRVLKHGLRNSNLMAIAPTATISNIVGVTQSIEPTYKQLFVKSNLSGEFTIPNVYLINKLREHDLWDDEMLDDLKYFDGSLSEIDRIPDDIKKLFLNSFEIDPEWLINCAERRQKWIDMGQSLNLYLAEPDGKKLSNMYLLAWKKGLKTTYYTRSLGATSVEKSTIDINKRDLQPRWMKNKSASGNVVVSRKSPVCNLEEGCESCQ
ncbi:Ribonucleoside-diphosphate reductase subunit alpha [Candidatus Clavichlamydia salmonicola]|uniref:ribonucleoside-diphosphate reductase subunit alpha n=1 Tax=Candidatus Clavichlamydia salmonicola TaxID=469812 RepID=UPI001E3AF67C|nr:ribonucleoside-diphosphate reductase subunit alpha [Candidatus Clavichlamydia salmonicola]MBF5050449.1 Ribonucleoside-diphosphate reductase subunit alpha [Candidatus Clavichlamydia salmonicola]